MSTPGINRTESGPLHPAPEREFVIDNLLVRIHSIIVMIRWTGLAPWESTPGISRTESGTLHPAPHHVISRHATPNHS